MIQYYISIKLVKAEKMNKHVADKILNKPTANDVSKDIEGYLVEYESGYKSWCPKKEFEEGNVFYNNPYKVIYKLLKILFS